MAKKTKQQPPTLEEMLASGYKEAMKKVQHYKNEPTRIFEIGELVLCGNHDKTEILKSFEGGKFYLVRHFGFHDVYGIPTAYENQRYCFWIDLNKIKDRTKQPDLRSTDKLEIRFSNSSIDSLLFMCYRGVNFDPDYQRDLVWTLEDKVALIDSIFNNIEIGKFAFIKLNYETNKNFDWDADIFHEILDGKQRLTTLMEFYKDRFQYKGLYFSEMKAQDRHHFENFSVTFGETDEPNDRNKLYKYFVQLNTSGKAVDIEHIEKIKNLIK